jgi:hypothetical protein
VLGSERNKNSGELHGGAHGAAAPCLSPAAGPPPPTPPLLDFQPFDRDPTRQNIRYPFRGYFAKETPRIKGINPPSHGVSSGLRFLSFENVFPIGFIQNMF